MSDSYSIGSLEGTPFETIHAAMLEAFADYPLDMSYMTKRVLWCRAMKNGVDLACSPGAFFQGKLVGLTLVGIGSWLGEPAAFDACTGIVKDHRGFRLAGRMFEAALLALKSRGTKRFVLEVLQDNEPAIKAYQRTDFKITRSFACYQKEGTGHFPDAGAWTIRDVGRELLDEFESELDWQPSWENRFEAIRAIPDDVRIRGAFDGSQCVGIAAYYPTLRWLLTLAVKRSHRRRGVGRSLLMDALRAAGTGTRPVRANNIDPSDPATHALLQSCGFTIFTNQYEMIRKI